MKWETVCKPSLSDPKHQSSNPTLSTSRASRHLSMVTFLLSDTQGGREDEVGGNALRTKPRGQWMPRGWRPLHPPASLSSPLLAFPLPPVSKTLQPILIFHLGWWFQLGLAASRTVMIILTPCGQCFTVCKAPFTRLIALNPAGSFPPTSLPITPTTKHAKAFNYLESLHHLLSPLPGICPETHSSHSWILLTALPSPRFCTSKRPSLTTPALSVMSSYFDSQSAERNL